MPVQAHGRQRAGRQVQVGGTQCRRRARVPHRRERRGSGLLGELHGASYRQRPRRTLSVVVDRCRALREHPLAPSRGRHRRGASPDRGMQRHPRITRSGLASNAQIAPITRVIGFIPHLSGRSTSHVSEQAAAAARAGGVGLHAHRAPDRARDHRHPAGDRRPVLPRLQGSRRHRRPRRPTSAPRSRPSRRTTPTTRVPPRTSMPTLPPLATRA